MAKVHPLILAARVIINRIGWDYIRLGQIFLKIRGEVADTDKSWRKVCKKHLGFDHRKAMYVIAAYKAYKEGYVDKKRAIKIGWYKLGVIYSQLGQSKKEDKYWINLAQKSTCVTLTETLKNCKEGNYTIYNFRLRTHEVRALENALMNYGALRHGRGLRNKEKALLAILMRSDSIECIKKSREVVARVA